MANTYTQLIYHLVFSTKNRDLLIHETLRENLYQYMGGIARKTGGKLIQIGGMPDHVHMVVQLNTTPSLADVVKTIKAKSSKWLNGQTDFPGKFAWQTGFGAFTVSASQLPTVVKYVQNQFEHHREKSFKEDVSLLEKHNIKYEEKYVWG